ncbi:hypothetical protein DFH29DRAFT_985488 [Suillus ampliporus]|nr:hypothetical protein DFH29DRAFT_985488 [Suillus ampliporus]
MGPPVSIGNHNTPGPSVVVKDIFTFGPCDATLQTDGWTGVNFRYLLAFMITTAMIQKNQVHTVRVVDVSAQCKTAQHLKILMISVIKEVWLIWKVNIVTVTSDVLGESWAARKWLVEEFPSLVSADYYAHQINLVVSDYFKSSSGTVYLGYSKKASDHISWLQSKTLVLATLRDIQVALNSTNLSSPHHVLTVICALLDLKFALDILIRQEKGLGQDSKIVTGDAASRKKATEMLGLIEDPVMWMTLARFLIIFGFLISRYIALQGKASSVEENSMIQAIIDSLEKPWSKCDQDVFLAAVVLNPLYRIKPFACLHKFTNAGLMTLFVKLWG